MEKKEWVRPRAVVQEFTPNEYVCACYKIRCNVPYGIGYIETNGIDGYQAGGRGHDGDKRLGVGQGCNVYHVGVNLDEPPTENAMWQEMDFWGNKGAYYPVFHWSTGRGDYDQHFSKVADAEWETNPNAS